VSDSRVLVSPELTIAGCECDGERGEYFFACTRFWFTARRAGIDGTRAE
jgi:hypothetical protein